MSAPELTTRSATLRDVDVVLAFWERAGENEDRPPDSADAVRRLIGRDADAPLLDAADQRLTAAGARRIDAMVLESNQPARKLWSRAGYTRQSTWARWVKPIARRAAGA